ncbi:unnamed protein product, partial [Prorocentrum cordatum]
PPPAQCRGAEREKTLACSPPSSDPGRPRGRRGRPARGPRAGLTTLRGRPRRMRRLIMPASVGRGRVVAWRARSWHRSDVRIVPSARSIEEHPSIIWRTSHARNRQKHREWTSERWPAVGCGSGGRCVGRVLPGAWIRGGPRVHGKAPISAAERGGSGRVLGRAPPPMRGFGDHAPDLWIARSTPARPRAWGGHATAGGRCAHAPKALCVLGSEGSFLERRARLDARLRRSLAVTRAELVRRNIVQGVSVVRRASHALEAWLPRRPPLGALIAAGRLATDYVDRAFPIRRDKEAPLAERVERVLLERLLAPPAPQPRAPLRTLWPPHGLGSDPGGDPVPPAPSPAPRVDPAALASVVVQVLAAAGALPPAWHPAPAGRPAPPPQPPR